MKVQILGTGCPTCQKFFAHAEGARERFVGGKGSGIKVMLEKVEDISLIVTMGAATTPALAIDGEVVAAGRLLTEDEILSFMDETLED